jgi:BirA family transcriptional regulator, biotin operon repressor / biotin---[acetyl-CoA-carboxylase] ligase
MSPPRHIGTRHIHLDATDSTNNRAAEFAHDPAYAGMVVTADLQSQGRGQHGRVWQSPPGTNVLLSTLLFPPAELRRPAILTAFAAVVVAETVLQVTGKQATIKWPNDVLLGGKKVSGILIESSTQYSVLSTQYFVVGIGLNVNQSAEDFEKAELPEATSLSISLGQKLDVKGITQLLIENLDEQYARLLSGEIAALEECWAWRLGKAEEAATVELMDASEQRGRLRRIAFDGLTLEQPDGSVRLLKPEEVRHIR